MALTELHTLQAVQTLLKVSCKSRPIVCIPFTTTRSHCLRKKSSIFAVTCVCNVGFSEPHQTLSQSLNPEVGLRLACELDHLYILLTVPPSLTGQNFDLPSSLLKCSNYQFNKLVLPVIASKSSAACLVCTGVSPAEWS